MFGVPGALTPHPLLVTFAWQSLSAFGCFWRILLDFLEWLRCWPSWEDRILSELHGDTNPRDPAWPPHPLPSRKLVPGPVELYCVLAEARLRALLGPCCGRGIPSRRGTCAGA